MLNVIFNQLSSNDKVPFDNNAHKIQKKKKVNKTLFVFRKDRNENKCSERITANTADDVILVNSEKKKVCK